MVAPVSFPLAAQSQPGSEPGLVMACALAAGKEEITDLIVVPNLALYVPSGKSPAPFLSAGKFTARWNGVLSVDLRSDYEFQAELNGDFKLEINGATVLEVSGDGKESAPGKPVRLNKGTNTLAATFRSPAQGDAFIRLFWFNRASPPGPIPSGALAHSTENADLQGAEKLHLGRDLFLEYRCQRCHLVGWAANQTPELDMDAPSLEAIGSRRNFDWLSRWILDPRTHRPTASMPRILRGPKAIEETEAIAAFLVTQKDDSPSKQVQPITDEQKAAGKKLFDTLHCAACHNAPDGNETDIHKISLKQVRAKFAAGTLPLFLVTPEAHYAWTRMPNFKLKPDEADQLAAFLYSAADKPAGVSAPNDNSTIERGKKLVQTSGCLNCHALKLANQFSTKSLSELTPDKWKQGCLAEKPADDSKSPQFTFTADEREALQAFAATDRASLTRHVPAEFAARQSLRLNCRECHGKIEGLPPFEILGEKLKPEWTAKFLTGEISYKPRPWLESRMPAFAHVAGPLAQGLAVLHGYPPQTPVEPPINMDAAKAGQKLVSAAGGFSCTTCHSVGSAGANQVFETPGLNLAHSGERLLKPYFQRWLRNPLQIDPATKMPVFFDENGRSPLTDYYDGDGDKTINAIWQYLRLGDKMPPPPMP